MKKIVMNACKNNIPYYTFFDPLATEALKSYLRDREAKQGKIEDEEIIFPPYSRGARIRNETSRFKPIGRNGLETILWKAARNAGIRDWGQIHPHCLRKSFEEAVRRRRPDGTMMGEKDQQFILGHILSGSEDPYYGSGVKVQGSSITFDRKVADKLREEYRMLEFFPSRKQVNHSQMLATFNRQFLKLSSWTDVEIEALGDLSSIEESRLQQLIAQKHNNKLGANGAGQKVVPISEVKGWLAKGFEFVTKLDDKDAIVRLPK